MIQALENLDSVYIRLEAFGGGEIIFRKVRHIQNLISVKISFFQYRRFTLLTMTEYYCNIYNFICTCANLKITTTSFDECSLSCSYTKLRPMVQLKCYSIFQTNFLISRRIQFSHFFTKYSRLSSLDHLPQISKLSSSNSTVSTIQTSNVLSFM